MRAVELSLPSAPFPLRQAARLPRAARNQTRVAFSPRAFRPTVSQTEQQPEKRRSTTTLSSTQYRVLVTGSTKGAAYHSLEEVPVRVSSTWTLAAGSMCGEAMHAVAPASHTVTAHRTGSVA